MKEISLLVFVAAALAGLRMEVVHGIQVGVISNLRIETEVNNRYAVTHVTSRMKNPSNVSQELFFKMQLPKTAFVSSLIMEVEGKNYTSTVQEKGEAQKTYDKAKSRGKDTGLVQQSLKNFQVSANVAPHHKITFYLKYEELLQRSKGSYNISINVKHGQAVQELMVKVSIKETEPLTNVILQQSPENEYESLDAMKMELLSDRPKYGKSYLMSSLKGTLPLEITWPSPREVEFVYHRVNKKANFVSDGVLSLSYDIERKVDGGELKVEDNYFAHFFSPEGLPPLRKHTIFVIDVSGSMAARNIVDVKSAMEAILKDMKKHDYFEVITFNHDVVSLGIFRGGKKSLARALKKVKNLEVSGDTNINQALLDAVTNIKDKRPNVAKQIVFLTDGHASTGVTDHNIIRKNVRAANKGRLSIFSLAFGPAADLQFLRSISSDNRGFARRIYEHSSPADQLTGFYDEISKPLLYDLDLDYDNASVVNDSLVHLGRAIYYVGGENLLEKMEVEEDPKVKESMKSRALEMALDYHFVTKLTSLVVVRPEDLEDEDSEEKETKYLENDSEQDEKYVMIHGPILPTMVTAYKSSSTKADVVIHGVLLPSPSASSRHRQAKMSSPGKAGRDEEGVPMYGPPPPPPPPSASSWYRRDEEGVPMNSPLLPSQIVHGRANRGHVYDINGRTVIPGGEPVDHQPRQHFSPHHTTVAIHPFCFDFHGKSGDVVSLIRDEVSGVIVNGLVNLSVSKSRRTFFTNLFLSLRKVNITITPSTFKVDCPVTDVSPKLEESDDSFEAKQEMRSTNQPHNTTNGWGNETKSVDNAQPAEVKSHPNKCNQSLTWEDVVGFRFLDVHFELSREDKVIVGLGNNLVRFVVTRSRSKRGQRFLAFSTKEQNTSSPMTKRISGEFSNKFVSIAGSIRKTKKGRTSSIRTMVGTTPIVSSYISKKRKIPCHILPCLQC
ncbi:inter-alpha-trypsin inhibitor heavy chain H3-like isoform X2 [Oratosquilla oratoria]|uniref:inter-alpha-trypsin inhibitor heavy chain H3-like isoform X2 n=1 Tax=Oratosquilla oratoria TaxID=337810 RepID=UPI003F7619B0